jgi:NADP-dependent 3-hydroxy acid dehydrogenase YdfG
MKSFEGKVAAVTGAGSGIGRALSLELARHRCHLALSDVDASRLEETATLCRPSGTRVTATRLDIADREAVYGWADTVAREHSKVNLVFNNAGVSLAGTLEGARYDDLQWIMNVNFWGVVHGTKAFLPHLRASGDGHVINTSSLFGLMALAGHGAYNATKFAVRGFTEALRQELEIMRAPVSATCVHPGGIKTNIARAARVSESVRDLSGPKRRVSLDENLFRKRFEELFITSPERAAQIILRAVRRNRRRVLVGRDAVFLDLLIRFWPGAAHKLALALGRRLHR